MIIVTSIVKTCESCPAQWEGRTQDGRWVYARYRSGTLRVGVGDTLTDAVRAGSGMVPSPTPPVFSEDVGDALDGVMSYDTLKMLTAECVQWPSTESERT